MKRNLLSILFCLGAITAFNTKSQGQFLIHYWNFNSFDAAGTKYYFNTTPVPNADLVADYTVITSGPAPTFYYQPIPGTSSSYGGYYDSYPTVSTLDFDTVNLQRGDTAGLSFRARNPNDSSEILLYMPTTGYKQLVLAYGCEKSSDASGDSFNVFSYSNDSGAHWITSGSGLSEWSDSGTVVFRRITVAINDTVAYNNPKFVFRITFQGNTALTSGNNRFDNITLMGDTLPGTHVSSGINQVTATQPNYMLAPNPATNYIDINGNLDGDKSILITNIVGQVVFSGTEEGTHFSVNTAGLNSGLYFITIRENNTGNISKLKFIKQ